MDFRRGKSFTHSTDRVMLMKWVFVIVYCVMVAGLANIRSCGNDDFTLHAGAYNHVKTLPE